MEVGPFDTFLLNQIAARPYFMPILTPGTLQRCIEDGDWVLREIQEAIRLKRMILPLYTLGFRFSDMDEFLPADIARELKRYHAVEVPHKFFHDVMPGVRQRYLRPVSVPTIS